MASAGAAAAAGAGASNECGICCEKFNASKHARIICDYGDCNYAEACKTCVRHYILNTASEPHCMQCKKAWSQKFLVENLNKSYISKEYKTHKKQFLLDSEISKLPESMDAAEKYTQIQYQENKKRAYLDEIALVKQTLARLNENVNECNVAIYNIKTGHGAQQQQSERKTFIMPCPNNDCRGYLSTQYKCQMCNLQTCAKCHEIMGHSKEADHTCKEENVQTAEMIKKETKGCPCCGTRIFKISGCDQMWCTTCHKAFSWRTGHIETGVVHNPHFYEYQRQTNGGVAPRNPGDVPCGGLCSWHQMNAIQSKLYGADADKHKHYKTITPALHRCIAHIVNNDMRLVRDKLVTLSDNTHIRVDYIIKKISKEEMAKKVYQNNVLRQKYTEIVHIYELISAVGIDFFQTLIDSKLTGNTFYSYFAVKVVEFNKLRIYCNEQFAIISNTYSQTVPQIDADFQIVSRKLTIKKTQVKGKAAAAAADASSDTASQIDDDIIDDEDVTTPTTNVVVKAAGYAYTDTW